MKTRTFETVWQDIKKLEGKDVFTLRHLHKNQVKEANETGLKIRTGRSKNEYWLTKGAFETVWEKLLDGEFVPTDDGGYYFVCACLEAALPSRVGHYFKDGILVLYLKKEQA